MADRFNDSEQKDLEKFLTKVNSLEEIVKGFQSTDLNEQNEAINKADEMLKKETTIGYDVTKINDAKDEDNTPDPGMQFSDPHTSQQAFMNALEADANKRARARKERHERANEVKAKANAAFQDGDYKTAMKFYSEAISISKDMTLLYTNRGMTYVKLGQYQDAINDCDIAMHIEPSWIKAYVIKGNALKHMRKYEESIKTYKEILEYHPKKTKLVEGYVAETEEECKVDELEKQAKKSLEDNVLEAERIAKLIALLGARFVPDSEATETTFSCFAVSIKILGDYLIDDQSRTIFRIEGGFKILAAKPCLRDVLLKKSFANSVESDFAQSVLMMIQAACAGCPQNTIAFLEEELMPEMIINLIRSKDRQVKHGAIVCFFEFAYNNKMIELVTKTFSAPRILSELLSDDLIRLKLLEGGVSTINRYAASERFRRESECDFDSLVLQVYHKFIDEFGHNQRKELPLCLKSINIFMDNQTIYSMIAANVKFLRSCLTCLERVVHVLEPNNYRDELLSTLIDAMESLLMRKSDATVEIAPRLAATLLPVLNWKENHELVMKALIIITRCLERSKESTKCFQSPAGLAFIKKIYKFIKRDHPSARAYSLKLLCHCGQDCTSVLRNLPKIDKAYNILRKVLNTDSTDIDVKNQGQAALLMGFLAELPGGMDPIVDYKGDDSNVVKHMLDLARYSKDRDTKYNCVISLGKMAKNDGRIMGELHRFDGFNILARLKPPDV